MQEMNSKQQKFITLRADGISFDKIVKDLKVSKPTLIQWSKLFDEEIKDLQFESFIQIKELYSWNSKKRYETLLKQLNKIDESILNADLTKSTIKDLYTIKNDIIYKLDSLERNITVNAKVTLTNELGYKENLDLKLNEIN
jgi:transposase